MLAGGDVAMAQRKKPLWKLCDEWDWAAVQQRIRDKDVRDINEKGGPFVSFQFILAMIMQAGSVEKCYRSHARDMKQKSQNYCNAGELEVGSIIFTRRRGGQAALAQSFILVCSVKQLIRPFMVWRWNVEKELLCSLAIEQ